MLRSRSARTSSPARSGDPEPAADQPLGAAEVAPRGVQVAQGVEQVGALAVELLAARPRQGRARRVERAFPVPEVAQGQGLAVQQVDLQVGLAQAGELAQPLLVAGERGLVLAQPGVEAPLAQLQAGGEGAVEPRPPDQLLVDLEGAREGAGRGERLGLGGERLRRHLRVARLGRGLGGAAVEPGGLGVGIDRRGLLGRPGQVGQAPGALAAAPEVLGHGRDQPRLPLAQPLFQQPGQAPVERDPPLGVEGRVEGLAERLAGDLVAGAAGLPQPLEVALRHQRVEPLVDRLGVLAEERGEQGEGERLGDDRRRLQDLALGRRQRREPPPALGVPPLGRARPARQGRDGGLPVAVPVLEHLVVHELPQDLLRLGGRALGVVVDPAVEAGREALRAQRGVDELGGRGAVEGEQRDVLHRAVRLPRTASSADAGPRPRAPASSRRSSPR